jgi:SET domain-containing protein
MLVVRTYVAPSGIEGLGVFAAEAVEAGAVLWRPDPRFDLAIAEAERDAGPPALKDLLDRYSYPCPLRPGTLIYETDNGRFMNHSDEPNTDFSREGKGVATRAIAPGEEITCDYAQFHSGFRGF